MTTKEFIKGVTIRELMLLTNDVASMVNYSYEYSDEYIDKIGSVCEYENDVDTLTMKQCHILILNFMLWVNTLRYHIYSCKDEINNQYFGIFEDDLPQFEEAVDYCLEIAKEVKGFKRFLNKKELDQIAVMKNFIVIY